MGKKILIAANASGSGKTTIVCAILQALINRKIKVNSFKCGPDYIDPMFHSKILGIKSRNLDSYFFDSDVLRMLADKNSDKYDISLIEGVMGLYDGRGSSCLGSTYETAVITETPIVLVLNCKGMGKSCLAMLKGYLEYENEARKELGAAKGRLIKAVIFNGLSNKLYPDIKMMAEDMGVSVLGNFPFIKDASLQSRHLGLVTADEIDDFKEKMQMLAKAAETSLDFGKLFAISEEAKAINQMVAASNDWSTCVKHDSGSSIGNVIRIAVARDNAFCFYYEDNLDLLKEIGCEIVSFSPLTDRNLPKNIDGLILGGGYPELYGRELMHNTSMRNDIKNKIINGLPTHAECGGFMYLHDYIVDADNNRYEMAGVIEGECHFTDKLVRFGYAELTADLDNILCSKGSKIKAHEFHRCQSSAKCDVFFTKKGESEWMNGVAMYNMLAMFPHIHYYANIEFAKNYIDKCREYHSSRKGFNS